MNSVVISWGLFLTLAGGIYWVYLAPKPTVSNLRPKSSAEDKGGNGIFVNASGTDGTGVSEKKKKKKKKPALSNTAPKEIVSTDDGFKAAESTDDDVAQEEDQAELLRRLQTLKEGSSTGNKKSTTAASSSRQLAPKKTAAAPASPFATASQTSSAGADADIDEEEAAQLPGSDYAQQSHSSDPRDMLESSNGLGVLKITSSSQLPRAPKQKTTSTASQSGVHASKNAKKKEKKKAEKDTEKADQKARFELHRATMRAAEATKQKTKPPQSADPPPTSAWTNSNGQAPSSSTAPKPVIDGLLDTFATPTASVQTATQHIPTDSEEERQQMRSTHLGDSYWEEIPEHLIGGWNEVQKKGRKQKKVAGEVQTGDESTDARSGRDSFQSKVPIKVPSKLPKAPSKIVKPIIPKAPSTGGNGFQLLDTGSTTSGANNSSSDWAEVDDLDNWAVHPEE